MSNSNSPNQIWMIRAGKGGDYVDDFLQEGFVGLGFHDAGEVDRNTMKSEVIARFAAASPNSKPSAPQAWASLVMRYVNDVSINDWVVTYDPNQRVYYLGIIKSDVADRNHPMTRSRDVEWSKKVSRDTLSISTRNTLGSILAMFLIKDGAAEELFSKAVDMDGELEQIPAQANDIDESNADQLEDLFSRSNDHVEDHIAKLGWSDMQELVSEILKAMGYRTQVSQAGPDQGVDIFASPDGLGLSEPRVFVEVKHRTAKMGSQEIRAFLGGRQTGDRCLYVSTGGFSKDAKYEAQRSPIPITLISLPRLRELLIEHYENLSPAGKALVPLRQIYWPVER